MASLPSLTLRPTSFLFYGSFTANFETNGFVACGSVFWSLIWGQKGQWDRFLGYYLHCLILILFFKYFIYLFLERGREGEREGEKQQCVVASCVPANGDLAHNPGMCSRLGIEPMTLWFTSQHSIHWAIPARTYFYFKAKQIILSQMITIFPRGRKFKKGEILPKY